MNRERLRSASFDLMMYELECIEKTGSEQEAFAHWDRFWMLMRDLRVREGEADFTPAERAWYVNGMRYKTPDVYHALKKFGIVREV